MRVLKRRSFDGAEKKILLDGENGCIKEFLF
jgi:hypothetical protein